MARLPTVGVYRQTGKLLVLGGACQWHGINEKNDAPCNNATWIESQPTASFRMRETLQETTSSLPTTLIWNVVGNYLQSSVTPISSILFLCLTIQPISFCLKVSFPTTILVLVVLERRNITLSLVNSQEYKNESTFRGKTW